VPTLTPVSIAIDAGTTGVRALVVDDRAHVVDAAYRELTQYYPRPGWVEHDADEIWRHVRSTLAEVAARLAEGHLAPRAVGITNQRETVVAWDRTSGSPVHRAIVWQDRRTTRACRSLQESGHLPMVRRQTGLVLDPYFSASKMQWLLAEGGVERRPGLALGTVDSWVLWNLTGGTAGGIFATDSTNASRTMLFDIVDRRWSDELCDLFDIPEHALASVRPSCGRFGRVAETALGHRSPLRAVPVSGIAGDQHAALFGQACFDPGTAKVTVGTGSFVMLNAGPDCPDPVDGLVTTLAWDLGVYGGSTAGADHGPGTGRPPVAYALEGSVFVSGAGVQWLRDGLGIIDHSSDLEPLARTVAGSDGVMIVPAFAGLGSPNWDPEARGVITGLSRGVGRAHLARAMIEAMAYQVRDVIDTMATTSIPPLELRMDGGAAAMDLLLQMVSDQTGLPVVRPNSLETTAVGVAALAGLAEGVWGSLDDLSERWTPASSFSPAVGADEIEPAHQAWRRAVDHSRGWASENR
jgi:glycerol kinase